MAGLGSGTGTLEVCVSCFRHTCYYIDITDSSSPSHGWCDHWEKWRMHQQHTANLWRSITVS